MGVHIKIGKVSFFYAQWHDVDTASSGLPEKMKINFQLLAVTKNKNCICHGLFWG